MSPEARERSFDELARGLANGSISRGKALKLMGAALVGGTLGSLGIGGIAAAAPPGCRHNGKQCKRDKQCCSGNCSSHGRCVGGAPGAGAGPPECVNCECGFPQRQGNKLVCVRTQTVCVQRAEGENPIQACIRVCGGQRPRLTENICNFLPAGCREGCRGPA
jgi:hypothetical protein